MLISVKSLPANLVPAGEFEGLSAAEIADVIRLNPFQVKDPCSPEPDPVLFYMENSLNERSLLDVFRDKEYTEFLIHPRAGGKILHVIKNDLKFEVVEICG